MTQIEIESESALAKHWDFCIGTFVASHCRLSSDKKYPCRI